MKSLVASVVTAMDGSDNELFSFFPYIFQDLWELGALPEVIIKLVSKHLTDFSTLKFLDLGCGKGAVSIKLAQKFNCRCVGIDAIGEFIREAKKKAKEFGVQKLCQFKVGDIRKSIKDFKNFDVIILGAIGPVFGDYYETLTTLLKCLKNEGFIIIDDGYIPDNSDFTHSLIKKRGEILKQISYTGMRLIDEVVMDKDWIKDSDEFIIRSLKKRCYQLMEKYPAKRNLFLKYVRKQERENAVLETKVVCSTMLIGKTRQSRAL